jgi:ketosteroid isomerase-like protein
MKRIPLSLSLLCAVVLLPFGLTSCQPASEPPANTAPPVVRETPPDVAGITAELTRIENDWPRVIKEKDVEAVRKLEADDYFGVLPDGTVTNKEIDLKDYAAGSMTFEAAEFTDIKVTTLDNDGAVVTGRTILKGAAYKAPNGKSMDISGQYRFVDTFARRNGAWKLVASVAVKMSPEAIAGAAATPSASPAAAAATPATKATPAAAKPSPAATKAVPPPPAPKTTP